MDVFAVEVEGVGVAGVEPAQRTHRGTCRSTTASCTSRGAAAAQQR
jgi:hypothetical protein